MKIAILVPCYRRIEYTRKCIKALEEAQKYENVCFCLIDDGSKDGTEETLREFKLDKISWINEENMGLRNVLIDFIEWARSREFDFVGVVGNDCKVPKNWLNNMLDIFEKSDVQILSPNVFPSNAAFKYGEKIDGLSYMPSKIVGGLWFMYTDLVTDVTFERHNVRGIAGAFNILQQILIEKKPKVGWAPDIVVQDMGHWSGKHPEHIKSKEHLDYYQEVGRGVSWG